MINKIEEETKKALKSLEKAKLSIRRRDLIKQMTAEIERYMKDGYWDFAVRLSFYRHEFAKSFKNLDWYPPFLEIRKTRDKIKILAEKCND